MKFLNLARHLRCAFLRFPFKHISVFIHVIHPVARCIILSRTARKSTRQYLTDCRHVHLYELCQNNKVDNNHKISNIEIEHT